METLYMVKMIAFRRIAQFICAFLPVFCLAQSKLKLSSISYSVGAQKTQYSIPTATSSEIETPLAFLNPSVFSLVFSDSLTDLQIAYKIQNFRQGSPSWDNLAPFRYTLGGPFYEHGLDCFYSRLIVSGHRLDVFAGLGASLNYIPYNRFDDNDFPPNDSIYIGYNIRLNEDREPIYEMRYYGRFVTSIYCTVNARLMASFNVSKRLSLTWAAIYRQGLFTMFKSDFWYENHEIGESGSGQMINRGTAYGFEFGLKYNIRKL